MIDTISMKLVMAPQQYDVVVTTNQFGDILSDIGAGLVGGLGLGARPLRRRAPGHGAGDPRLGAGHRRTQHRQSLCHDHVGPDAAGLAWPQAQRAEGDRRRRLYAEGDRQGHRRSQAPDRRSRRQGQHPGDGRRHRGGRRNSWFNMHRKIRIRNAMYNLHLSAEQLEIRDTVRDFVTREIKPVALKAERLDVCDRRLPMQLLDQASQMGLRTLALSEDRGGAGADHLTCCIVTEELAAGDADIAAMLSTTSWLGHLLFDRADDRCPARALPAEVRRRRSLSSRLRRP